MIAAALLGIAYGPTASAVTAVAFSPSTDRYGVAWNEPDKETALRKAKEDCLHRGGAKDCKQLRVTEEKGFGAIAQTCAGDFCGLSVITGRGSAKQAEADALSDCNSYYGVKDCRVYDNWEERGAVAAPKSAETVGKSVDSRVSVEKTKGTKSLYSKKLGKTLRVERTSYELKVFYPEWQLIGSSDELLINTVYYEKNGIYTIWNLMNHYDEKVLKAGNYEWRSVASKNEVDCSKLARRIVEEIYLKNYRKPGEDPRSDDIRGVRKLNSARWETDASDIVVMLLCKGGE